VLPVTTATGASVPSPASTRAVVTGQSGHHTAIIRGGAVVTRPGSNARSVKSILDRAVRFSAGATVQGVTDSADHEGFTAMYEKLSPRVFGYVRRSCNATTAQDVVADVFMVAWRRHGQMPDDPLPWLLVVARNTLANRRRREQHQDRLADTIAHLERVAGPAVGVDESIVDRHSFLAALATLTFAEREALLLVAWDGLPRAVAAKVAGCSQRAFEVRLSRARARLTRAVAQQNQQPGVTTRKAR
jgi:RNA polymerase sigma factor (sigma-70 family)